MIITTLRCTRPPRPNSVRVNLSLGPEDQEPVKTKEETRGPIDRSVNPMERTSQ